MKHYQVLDNNKQPIVNNLATECIACFIECNSPGKLIEMCPKYGYKRRQGKIENSKSITFLCCDKTKTTKLFREKLESLSIVFPDLVVNKNEIEESIKTSEQLKVNRLVHNLTSINAFNIQEIYALVPQSTLSSNWKDQLNVIQKEIKKNPKQAAMTFLRLAKNNIHMKSEFSIYRKLDRRDKIDLEFQTFNLKTVVLNVLHTFFSDFSDKNIYVDVADFYEKVKIDYETIQVALYHLIENALKYSRPNSSISIEFDSDDNNIHAKFFMSSIYIKEEERDLIFKEGYSGEIARKMKKSGDGIGMWRIKQMMELNGGSFYADFGDDISNVIGFDFANNVFILTFKK